MEYRLIRHNGNGQIIAIREDWAGDGTAKGQ